MAYYLKYIAHEKVPVNVRFALGKDVHYMIERFYKYNYKSADSFANFWKFHWFRHISGKNLKGKAQKETNIREYKTKKGVVFIGDHVDLGQNRPDADPVGAFFGSMILGANILKRFYSRHIPEKKQENGKTVPIHNEFGFGTKKSEPFIIDGIPIRGFLDRIDKRNDNWWVTDYKTDRQGPSKDPFTLHRHPQFTLYSYAFRRLFGVKEKAVLYYHLRSGKVFETHRSEKDFDYFRRLMNDVAESITADKFVPFYGFHCNFCDLKPACEKYCMKEHGGPSLNLEGKIKQTETFDDWDAALTGTASFLEMQSEPN